MYVHHNFDPERLESEICDAIVHLDPGAAILIHPQLAEVLKMTRGMQTINECGKENGVNILVGQASY